MKSLMILGGFAGFALGLSLGLIKGSSWSTILWRSSVAALTVGILLRWWGKIWIQSLADAQRERQEAENSNSSRPSAPVARQASE